MTLVNRTEPKFGGNQTHFYSSVNQSNGSVTSLSKTHKSVSSCDSNVETESVKRDRVWEDKQIIVLYLSLLLFYSQQKEL